MKRYAMGFFKGAPAMFEQPDGDYVKWSDVQAAPAKPDLSGCEVMVDGEGIELESGKPFSFACCDCGLTHRCVIVSEDGKPVGFAVERDQAATAEKRTGGVKTCGGGEMAELLERCGRCDSERPACELRLGVGQYAEARLCAHCRKVSQLPPGDYLLPSRQACICEGWECATCERLCTADPVYESREERYIGDSLWQWLLREQQVPTGEKGNSNG